MYFSRIFSLLAILAAAGTTLATQCPDGTGHVEGTTCGDSSPGQTTCNCVNTKQVNLPLKSIDYF